jgi:hypothetical protein
MRTILGHSASGAASAAHRYKSAPASKYKVQHGLQEQYPADRVPLRRIDAVPHQNQPADALSLQ